MAEVQKITDDELQQLTNIQDRISQIARRIGVLYIQKKLITEEFQAADDMVTEIDCARFTLIEALQTKYGVGTVDIKTGIITPSE